MIPLIDPEGAAERMTDRAADALDAAAVCDRLVSALSDYDMPDLTPAEAYTMREASYRLSDARDLLRQLASHLPPGRSRGGERVYTMDEIIAALHRGIEVDDE